MTGLKVFLSQVAFEMSCWKKTCTCGVQTYASVYFWKSTFM